jgi:hypothetical protein
MKGLTMSEDNDLIFREVQKFNSWFCLVLVCSLVAAVVIIVSILAWISHIKVAHLILIC